MIINHTSGRVDDVPVQSATTGYRLESVTLNYHDLEFLLKHDDKTRLDFLDKLFTRLVPHS